MAFFQGKMVGNGRETEKIKIIVQIRFYTTRSRKFEKNSQKIIKSKKNHYGFFSWKNWMEMAVNVKFKNSIIASFQSKIRWRRPRKRDNENYYSDPFLPTHPQLKISKK